MDLASPECERQLDEFRHHPKFVGVRHVTQDEPDDDFIVRAEIFEGPEGPGAARRSLRPALLSSSTSATSRRSPRELPRLPMVIDHLAKPRDQGPTRSTTGCPRFRAAGAFPNVFCKLSGMITEADWRSWTAADLKPYVQAALEAFGPDRLMFGSDWPVCELAGSYERGPFCGGRGPRPTLPVGKRRHFRWHGESILFSRPLT